MKVGLEVRISLISVLSTGQGRGELPAAPKMFFLQKIKAISNTDHI